jgi:hypothetical protein
MLDRFSRFIDRMSNFFAPRKGLLPLLGIALVLLNLVIQFFPPGWLSNSDLFLHLGVIIAIFGFMLAWAL